jgi:phosphoribosylanthranilate isomerase
MPGGPWTGRVKVCGITSVEDARAVSAAGVDAVGLNFCRQSPRCLELERAKAIVAALPSAVLKVGVFCNAAEDLLDRTADALGLDLVQLHGDEDLDYCRRRSRPVIKVFRTKPGWDPREADLFRPMAILVDAYSERGVGGTGLTADWTVARKLVERGREVYLAGGLNADNVARAVEAVHPAAVDLNSGVEWAPGRKDLTLLGRALAALGRPPGTSLQLGS